MIRTRYVAALSLIFTVLFFIEYTPLLRRVHIPYDLEVFHYSLVDYAFQAIHEGRFPQWDPTIYSGLSFAGNTQAALFYPPTWLLFASNWGRSKLSYQSLEDLVIAHVWLAFLLCYIWLRHQRQLHPLAAALGGGIFAFSGYMLLQLQHFGLIAAYAWAPLGWHGVDQIDQWRSWSPLWKIVLASAMCFLAGYPTAWVVFSVCIIAYACARRGGLRIAVMAACGLAGSLLVAAIQLLPAWEAAQLMVKEAKYGSGSGIKDPGFFISYFAPNYFNFGLNVPIHTNPGRDYLYLGAAAFVGLALLPRGKRLRDAAPAVAVLSVSLLFLTNPFGLIGGIIARFDVLAEILSDWHFLAGLSGSIALLAALGLDHGLRRYGRPVPAWFAALAVTLSLAWSIRLAVLWFAGGDGLSISWRSGIDALVAALLLWALIFAFPGSSWRFRAGTAAAAIILVSVDYKVFGTSKRFNAARGRFSLEYVSQPFPGFGATFYESLKKHPEYRLALDLTGPHPLNLRHAGLTTPQGFDPFLPEQYRTLIQQIGHFYTNREFALSPENRQAMRLLGVRYFVTSADGPLFSKLLSSPDFRLVSWNKGFYKVFEYADAPRPFGWEENGAKYDVELKAWQAERRAFAVSSASGGRFRLTEQFYPGWTVSVDDVTTPVVRCHLAFQCVDLKPGRHLVEFVYHSRFLAIGGLISFLSTALLAGFVGRDLYRRRMATIVAGDCCK
jgi:hypothetical protein